MIKALVGELPMIQTSEATIWKHPNLRMSYVAQHAFHHVEQHLDKSATQYFLWRFAGGEDREAPGRNVEDTGNPQRKLYLLKNGLLTKVADEKDKSKAVEIESIFD